MSSNETTPDNKNKTDGVEAKPVETAANPVQVVLVSQDSTAELKGIRGWLLFFLVVLGLNGIGSLMLFFASLAELISGSGSGSDIVSAITMPIIGVVAIAAAVLIATRKQQGRLASQIAIAVMAVSSVIANIVAIVEEISAASCGYSASYFCTPTDNTSTVITGIGTIIVQLVIYSLAAYYFQKSKRVKATLVEK